ncbi:hypothetical protein CC80DRAFT_535663 [Byssothecium circinans]|uniref:Uncharacterized protein n=1 Tax=Byssothecium circinans TaxID=147558 RepID=A0A6A5U014_9PLEO|nr:hypothetical protein CC80DRAFT_535663 [Byssothecium circinans]
MGDSDKGEVNVAIVALIISVIALIVTSNQLLAQVLSSAEGYRRCSESVIGVWHRLRNRKWRWSEFRFETLYVTPQIVLVTPREFQEYAEQHREVYAINSPRLAKEECAELDRTVHQEYRHHGRKKNKPQSTRPSAVSSHVNGDVEKDAASPKRQPNRKFQRSIVESDNIVSWLRLLQELHRLSVTYWPEDCPSCTAPNHIKNDTEITKTNWDAVYDEETWIDEVPTMARTDIAVIYRVWSWDLMPPDMIRPLAVVSVCDIILLAVRLGIHWRIIEPELGKMQANGNGYTISAIDVRGLGLVLRFTASGPHLYYPRLIPSRAVDKMVLGILPGDPDLVKFDFPMVNEQGEVTDVADPNGLLRRIYAIGTCAKEIGSENFNSYLTQSLTEILERLDKLKLLFMDHQHMFPLAGVMKRPYVYSASQIQKSKFMDDIREMFDWTTNYFIKEGFCYQRSAGLTGYVNLVASHCAIASIAAERSRAFIEQLEKGKSEHDMLKQYMEQYLPKDEHYRRDFEDGLSYTGVLAQVGLHDLATRYVELVIDKSLHRFYEIGEPNDGRTEAAWWVMQLRGFVWHLSTRGSNLAASQILGKPIPSSLYTNKTPVWIT